MSITSLDADFSSAAGGRDVSGEYIDWFHERRPDIKQEDPYTALRRVVDNRVRAMLYWHGYGRIRRANELRADLYSILNSSADRPEHWRDREKIVEIRLTLERVDLNDQRTVYALYALIGRPMQAVVDGGRRYGSTWRSARSRYF